MKKLLIFSLVVTVGISFWIAAALSQPMTRTQQAEVANMQTVRANVTIDAPIEKVWSIIRENFDQNSRFNSQAKSTEYIKQVEGQVGSQRRTININGKYVDVEVLNYDPQAYFVKWEIIDTNLAPLKVGYASYQLEHGINGSTTLSQVAGFRMKIFLMDWVAKQKFTTVFKNELAAIKHLAETDETISLQTQKEISERYANDIKITNNHRIYTLKTYTTIFTLMLSAMYTQQTFAENTLEDNELFAQFPGLYDAVNRAILESDIHEPGIDDTYINVTDDKSQAIVYFELQDKNKRLVLCNRRALHLWICKEDR